MKVRSSKEIYSHSHKGSFLRRSFLQLLVIGILSLFWIFRKRFWTLKSQPVKTDKKFVLLGFDGADPRLVQKWRDELPNLRRLAEQGTYCELKTCIPPESPVAWSCFAVGGNPGHHGVYDFLRRPIGSYIPTEEAFAERVPAYFLFKSIPIKMPKARLRRGGTAFWDVTGAAGIPTTMIEVPITFPPPNIPHCCALSGLGVPDIRGTQATFHHFIYKPDQDNTTTGETTFGGKVEHLVKKADAYLGNIWGPYDPIEDQERREKQRERLDADLSWCEWQAHLFSIQGMEHVAPETQAVLTQHLALAVVQSMAIYPYLYSDPFKKRIDNLKQFLSKGGVFIKREGASASDARMAGAEHWKKSEQLQTELSRSPRAIKQTVSFKIIDPEIVEIRVGKQIRQVKKNTWSEWFTVTFPITRLISIRAICKFYLQSTSPELKVYMTSPDIDPRQPAVAISHPSAFSNQLVEWTGDLYKTRGWSEETHGLKDNRLSEEGFMDDLLSIMKTREDKTFASFEKIDANLFVSVFSETDRISHMFYHHIDADHPMHDPETAQKYSEFFKKVYLRMDEIVGRMMEKIKDDPNTVFIVMSDHGFQSMRYQVNLNTWLIKNGYMAIHGGQAMTSDMKLDDLLKKANSDFFKYVDWTKTKAYALGLGQIYINLKDREPLGIVEPSEYDALCSEIAQKLAVLRDYRWKQLDDPVIAYVKKRSEVWTGDYADDKHDAPDLQVGFMPGYRVSWQTCLGGLSPEIIEDNMEKWSGDHCSFAAEHVPGVFFCNRKLPRNEVSLFDFAPTILKYFGLQVPGTMEGKDLFTA